MKVERIKAERLRVCDLAVGECFSFASHLEAGVSPGVYMKTDKGYVVLHPVSMSQDRLSGALPAGCTVELPFSESAVLRARIDNLTIIE